LLLIGCENRKVLLDEGIYGVGKFSRVELDLVTDVLQTEFGTCFPQPDLFDALFVEQLVLQILVCIAVSGAIVSALHGVLGEFYPENFLPPKFGRYTQAILEILMSPIEVVNSFVAIAGPQIGFKEILVFRDCLVEKVDGLRILKTNPVVIGFGIHLDGLLVFGAENALTGGGCRHEAKANKKQFGQRIHLLKLANI
jgi:hypothetical protein